MKYLFALFLVVGCGNGVGYRVVDPAFQPYLDRFEALRGQKSDDISISFGAVTGADVGGTCTVVLGRNDVVINQDIWSTASDTLKEILIFHELGHCLLNRQHLNTQHFDSTIFNYVPDSIMNAVMIQEDVYTANRDAYIQELFTPAQ